MGACGEYLCITDGNFGGKLEKVPKTNEMSKVILINNIASENMAGRNGGAIREGKLHGICGPHWTKALNRMCK
jgi:hypothetical protein